MVLSEEAIRKFTNSYPFSPFAAKPFLHPTEAVVETYIAEDRSWKLTVELIGKSETRTDHAITRNYLVHDGQLMIELKDPRGKEAPILMGPLNKGDSCQVSPGVPHCAYAVGKDPATAIVAHRVVRILSH